jgi:hypothetical protein
MQGLAIWIFLERGTFTANSESELDKNILDLMSEKLRWI